MTPFYKKALALFTSTQANQIKKGMEKYQEPFNPHSWSPQELLNHALEETVDLTHYLVGLKEQIDRKDERIEKLVAKLVLKDKEIADLKEELEVERGFKTLYAREVNKLVKKQKSPFEEQYDINFNPHFDQDDQ